MLLFVAAYLLLINIITYAYYAIDKRRAKNGKYRIPESTLLLLAGIGGAYGALVAMYTLHHKTRHWNFRTFVPMFSVLWLIIIVVLAAMKMGITL